LHGIGTGMDKQGISYDIGASNNALRRARMRKGRNVFLLIFVPFLVETLGTLWVPLFEFSLASLHATWFEIS
jgi:hypothetical protein